MKPKFSRFLIASSVALAALTHTVSAQAINKETTGTDLTAGASWVGGNAPGSGNVATWETGSLGGALTIGSASSWQGIEIQAATAAISTTGAGTLTLGASGINIAAGGQNLTLGNSLTVGSSQSWTVGTGRTLLRTGATTTFNTGTVTTLSGAGTVEIGGTQALSGSGALIIDGASLFNNLQGGTQTRSGTTTLSSGIIKIQTSVSMFGSGALNINGGSIGSGNGTRRAISNTTNVGGNFEVGGTGLSTGAIQLSGQVDFGSASRQITTTSTLELTGTVTNAPALDKLGAGNLVLGVIDMSGTSLALSAGKLLLGGNGGAAQIGSLSGVAGTSIDSNYNLVSDGLRSLSVNQTTAGTYAGVISNAGGLTRAISLLKRGTAKLTLSGANTYEGGTTISQGTLAAITSNNALGTSGTVTINDTNTGSNNTALLLGNITMGRAITVANQGSGTTTLGANGSAALPTFSGAITLAKDVTLDGTGSTDRLTFTGGIGGTGNVTIAGGTNRVVLAGTTANTYNGTTTVSANSILQLSTGAASTTSYIPDASVVTLDSGSFLKLAKGANSETIGGLSGSGTVRGHEGVASIASAIVIDNSGNHSFGGVLENGGASGSTLSLTKTGNGTQTLSGTSTYTGATLVSAGTLLVNGALGNTAVTVGSNGTIGGSGSLGGSLGLAATSLLKVVDINDPLSVTGTITFGSGFGIANLTDINWDVLDLNTPYTLISTTQTFSTSDIANFGFGNRVSVGSLGREAYFTNGSLAVVVIPEPSAALLGGIGLLLLLRRRR